MRNPKPVFVVFLLLSLCVSGFAQSSFVRTRGHSFEVNGKPYYFVGTNYWYGSLLGLEKNEKRGLKRLRKELDFLKANGVTNLRLLGGAEGSGALVSRCQRACDISCPQTWVLSA
jgi:mannan endo-1,4-beta-mannosidase